MSVCARVLQRTRAEEVNTSLRGNVVFTPRQFSVKRTNTYSLR